MTKSPRDEFRHRRPGAFLAVADIFIDPKKTYLYIRQSTLYQVIHNTESDRSGNTT